MDPTWYQMELFIKEHYIQQNPHESDLFEACVIREVYGTNLLEPSWSSQEQQLNLTDRAMVGLNVNDVDWLESFRPKGWLPRQELEKMYFKLKIYACDDLDDALYVGE